MRRGQQDLIDAIDKRANDQIVQYSAQATLQVGIVEDLTLAGASVRLEGSGRYFKNVASMQGVTLAIGARVLLTRIGRSKWVILGAVEERGKRTPRTDTVTPIAAPAGMSVEDTGLGYARMEWTASFFDVRAWELMIGTSSVSVGVASLVSTFTTDNSQYDFEGVDGSYYTRVRAVGPEWKRSSWTAWQAFQITSSSPLHHGALSGLGDDDHPQYVLADGTRDLAFTPVVVTNWDGDIDPGDVDDALDQLAERVDDLETALVGDASDLAYTPGTASDWTTGVASEYDTVGEALDQLAERVDDLESLLEIAWVNGTSLCFGDASNYLEVTNEGAIELHGNARIYQNQWIEAGAIRVPGSNPATAVDWGIGMGYEFTDNASDVIYVEIRLPQDMDRSVAPQLKIGFSSATPDPGDDSKQVRWQLEYLYLAPNESTVAAAQETLTSDTSMSTVANGLTIATITGMDLPGATDQLLMLRVTRLGAADTLGDDCVLLGMGFKYVANTLGVSL